MQLAETTGAPLQVQTNGGGRQFAPGAYEWLATLFAGIQAAHGERWLRQFAGLDEAGIQAIEDQWLDGLQGMTREEIRRGMNAVRSVTHVSGLAHFRRLCRPALDPEVAWAEATAGMALHTTGKPYPWSHPAVYWAAREMQYELRNSAYSQVRARWSALMQRQWDLGQWDPVPDPAPQVEYVPKTAATSDPVSMASARQRLAEARERLVMQQRGVR